VVGRPAVTSTSGEARSAGTVRDAYVGQDRCEAALSQVQAHGRDTQGNTKATPGGDTRQHAQSQSRSKTTSTTPNPTQPKRSASRSASLRGGSLTLAILLEDQLALVQVVLVLSPSAVLAALQRSRERSERTNIGVGAAGHRIGEAECRRM
jgi:hypothetical protein